MRRAAKVPHSEYKVPPRFASDEKAAPPWSPSRVVSTATTLVVPWRSMHGRPPTQGLLDLIEYLAARPAPKPLGGLLELIASIDQGAADNHWSIARALLEAGVLEPLRVQGWRGSAVIPRGPRAVLCRTLIRAFLGPLLLEPRPSVFEPGTPRRVSSPAVATATGSSVATTEIWRWARSRRGVNS